MLGPQCLPLQAVAVKTEEKAAAAGIALAAAQATLEEAIVALYPEDEDVEAALSSATSHAESVEAAEATVRPPRPLPPYTGATVLGL